jgi:cell division septal protein FtsQ
MPEQIPSTHEWTEWEDGSPSSYRRRDKPVGVRRRRGTSAARILRVTFLNVLAPLAILCAAYVLALKATFSPCFLFSPEQNVRVSGNRVVTTEQVFEALGFIGSGSPSQISLFRLNLAAERRRVEAIPWIKSATITRIFPDRLSVRVRERTPIAFANVGGHIELVDGDGAFLRMPSKASFDFPVLDGLDSVANISQRKELLNTYTQFMHGTKDEIAGSGWKVSQADLGHPDDLRILLVQGNQTILVHFGDRKFSQRFKTFLSIAPRVLQSYPKINSMDLRYHNEVVVDPDLGGGQ